MFTMFACKRCQIKRIVGNYLLAGPPMPSDGTQSFTSVNPPPVNASANLMSGEAVLTLLWFSIESKDILLTIGRNNCFRRQGKTLL